MNNGPPHDRPAHIRLADVRMGFESRKVFEGLSCEFPRGEISVILGGSGVGKSTLLRLIAGLLQPQSGVVEIAGQGRSRILDHTGRELGRIHDAAARALGIARLDATLELRSKS